MMEAPLASPPSDSKGVICKIGPLYCVGIVLILVFYFVFGTAVSIDQQISRSLLIAVVFIGAIRFLRKSYTGSHEIKTLQQKPNRNLLILILCHVSLVGYMGWCNAPNPDEEAHLTAGLSHWRFGNFTLYRVNPPLVRMWGSIPLLLAHPDEEWSRYTPSLYSRPEFAIGQRFHQINNASIDWYFTFARWSLIPFGVVGLCVCYWWALELFGPQAALAAGASWCFCPNVMTWSACITPDACAAAMGLLASWRYWKYLRHGTWKHAFQAGIVLGLAVLTKFTWIVLFGLWPMMWLATKRTKGGSKPLKIGQLALVVFIGVYIIDFGYGFQGVGTPLKDFRFISQFLGGEQAHQVPGNRFCDLWFGGIPIPLPESMVQGMDIQKYDFERKKTSFLGGHQQLGGWWYYYLYALIVKTPVGFMALWVTRLSYHFVNREFSANDLFLLLLPATVLIVVSSQTGFSRYLRYVLPAIPFLFIWSSALFGSCGGTTCSKLMPSFFLLAGCLSSLFIFPLSHSYFNLLAGGPHNGHNYLLDANIDWGQDTKRLSSWAEKHPEVRPLYVCVSNLSAPGPFEHRHPQRNSQRWYAIGINQKMGYKPSRHTFHAEQLRLVYRIGYTIGIYKETNSDGITD